jgi:hypothetical protein
MKWACSPLFIKALFIFCRIFCFSSFANCLARYACFSFSCKSAEALFVFFYRNFYVFSSFVFLFSFCSLSVWYVLIEIFAPVPSVLIVQTSIPGF